MFAGPKLIGDIAFGQGAIEGANAVVNKDVQPSHAALGIPASCKPLDN